MKKSEVNKLSHGLYKIYWKSGGFSRASVGSDSSGNRWLAPTNWVTISEKPNRSIWKEVRHAEPLVLRANCSDIVWSGGRITNGVTETTFDINPHTSQ